MKYLFLTNNSIKARLAYADAKHMSVAFAAGLCAHSDLSQTLHFASGDEFLFTHATDVDACYRLAGLFFKKIYFEEGVTSEVKTRLRACNERAIA
jgi:hypothetical protein